MKIGIMGSGTIVPDFLKAANKIKDIKVKAICGREKSKDKLLTIANEYNIPSVFYNYDELLSSDNIDTIYIALPNNLHYAFCMKALLSGKNVILEKPFSSNYNEALELVNIAKEKKLYLMEAISNQYFPNYNKLKELIIELGEIKVISINFSQYSRRYDSFKNGTILPVFDAKMSGGALMDLNVYNIYFVIGLFGKPKKVNYFANINKGIDTSGILILEYDNFKASCIASKDSNGENYISVQGEKGFIVSRSQTNEFSSFAFSKDKENFEEYKLNIEKERLFYELQHFASIYNNKDYEKCIEGMEKSLLVMDILDKGRKNVDINF